MTMTDSIFHYADPADSAAYLTAKLAYYIDAWDLAESCQRDSAECIILDVRSADHYSLGHIPGAINFPHREMNALTLAPLSKQAHYVTYCDGIGCNGSTKGAYNLAQAGFKVKELIGGLDFWRRDNHPIIEGSEPSTWPTDAASIQCGC
ncbi:rhodanese [bacteria symbiont BFo2 of Frankliniella occidentalis]|nr:rhodanese-like domain-containing protein [Rosenbergiella epipactidis]KMV67280.1 rhodanese [bacteria symbiont BFo2 of Frankliniella occidentalis]KYP92461.1 rhodanese [bacteria symbiont BFo2 of Frankliniella occidentalis]KYP94771.1 rhodanese [bacteria symbiont BFo2 of Frankliniella occidentalis]